MPKRIVVGASGMFTDYRSLAMRQQAIEHFENCPKCGKNICPVCKKPF
jgi:hypothetical protein